MGGFEPIIIETRGESYVFTQGADRLLSMPAAVFDAFQCDSVFPPSWTAKESDGRETRQLLWHPASGEFLMGTLRETPPRLAERHGSEPFRSHLLAAWYPETSRLYLHPYWNPESPSESFGIEARALSLEIQRRFFALMARLRPPPGWRTTFNSRDRLITALEAPEPHTELPKRLSLAPPMPLGRPNAEGALKSIGTDLAGQCFPTVRENALIWVEAFGEEHLLRAREILDLHGLDHQIETFRSH